MAADEDVADDDYYGVETNVVGGIAGRRFLIMVMMMMITKLLFVAIIWKSSFFCNF